MINVNFEEIKLKSLTYNRHIIQALIEYDMPIIVTGIFKGISLSSDKKYIFSNIIPVSGNNIEFKEITDHINIDKDLCDAYYEFSINDIGTKFILTCRPYIYYDEEVPRGGLKISDELYKYNFRAIQLFEDNITKSIPFFKVVDFGNNKDFKFLIKREKQSISLYRPLKKRNNRPKKNKRLSIKGDLISQAKKREYLIKHSYNGVDDYFTI